MADPRFASAAIDAETNAVTALLNGGYMRIYTAPRPAAGDDPPAGADLLVELRFSTPAFGPSVAGVAVANVIASGLAKVTGDAAWYRTVQADGVTAVFDDTAGTAVDDSVVLDDALIQMGALVSLTSYQYTSPRTAG